MKWGRHPGRVREKLAELLAEKGLIVSPYDLWTQEGAYRSRYWDLARWGSSEARWKDGKDPDGKPYHLTVRLSSWSTMSDCVKYGIEIGEDDGWRHVAVESAR